jgi:hypothetical protein
MFQTAEARFIERFGGRDPPSAKCWNLAILESNAAFVPTLNKRRLTAVLVLSSARNA